MFDETELLGPTLILAFCFLEEAALLGKRRDSPNPEMYGFRSSSRRILDDFMLPWMYFLGLHS